MCTISFIPNLQGFYLGVNRDESLRRPAALPPETHRTGNRCSIYPSELSGGTWIGVNDLGLALALINWHPVPTRQENRVVSRGVVVRTLLTADNIGQSYCALDALPLRQMPPFRVFAIALRDRSVAVHSAHMHTPNLEDPALILKGAGQYAAMCVGCFAHGET